MSLLMPEYQRQLRAAARRLAGHSLTTAKPSRGGLGSWLLLALTGAVTVAIAISAVVLLGHGGSPAHSAAARPAIQYDCPPHQILRTKGPLVPTARGSVGGQRWTLELDSARHGLRSVLAGRLMLGGRAYGFCDTRPPPIHGASLRGDFSGVLDVELVNTGRYGIVYGLAARPYRPSFVIDAATAHGTAAHPVVAHRYSATTLKVPQGTLFLRSLPASACAYHDLGVDASERPTSSGTGRGVLVFYKFTRSCAPGQLRQTR
jgi:hypothetical protein